MDENQKPTRPPDPDDLKSSEIRFCRSFAARGDPAKAFAHGWPRQAARFKPETVERRIGELLKMGKIQNGIEHYQADMEAAARERLDWIKAKRATEQFDLEKRLGINKRDIRGVIDRGTPELRGKMKRDVLDKLRAKGDIGAAHIDAAREIVGVIMARQRSIFSRPLDGTRVDQSYTARDPGDLMSGEESEAYHFRYLPWLDTVGARFVGNKKRRITIAQLVYDVILNNRGPRQIEDDYQMQHGTATDILRDALWRYAVQMPGVR